MKGRLPRIAQVTVVVSPAGFRVKSTLLLARNGFSKSSFSDTSEDGTELTISYWIGALGLLGDPGLFGDGGIAGSSESNRSILARFVQAMANADADAAAEVVDVGSFVDHSPGWGSSDFDSVMTTQRALRAAMPDLSYELDTTCMVSEADQVAGHSVVRGTHTGGPLYGADPAGTELVWTHSDFVRIADGKIVERWTATDMLTLFQQAGVLPSMGG